MTAHLAVDPVRFKGIRHNAAYDPGVAPTAPPGALPGLFLDPTFRAGVARTGKMGPTFEVWCRNPQPGELQSRLAACPDGRSVLRRLGGPLGDWPYKGQRAKVRQLFRLDQGLGEGA